MPFYNRARVGTPHQHIKQEVIDLGTNGSTRLFWIMGASLENLWVENKMISSQGGILEVGNFWGKPA